MASQKHFEDSLEPLTTLVSKVEEFAALCKPDVQCTHESTTGLSFIETDFDEDPEVDFSGPHVTMAIEEAPEERFMFTEWSRQQLLAHLGTREKWFAEVSTRQQAHELSKRAHTFEGHRFRVMSTGQPKVSFVRGLVSKEYADIPDTEVLTAATGVLGDSGRYLRGAGGKTDRALYAYCAASTATVGLRGVLEGYPGFVIKNSEVGYTSLWVIPLLYLDAGNTQLKPVVFERQHLFRRVHRGSLQDLKRQFAEALDGLSAVWGSLTEKLRNLRGLKYQTEDEALDRLRSSLSVLRATKGAILDYERAYRAANNRVHDGVAIFHAVLSANRASTTDAKYDEAELAGALLWRLL